MDKNITKVTYPIMSTFFILIIIITTGLLAYSKGLDEGTREALDQANKNIAFAKHYLTISYNEKDNPTNCSKEILPQYLTTDEISRSDKDKGAFFIMLIAPTQWDCQMQENYGITNSHGKQEYNWCDCTPTIGGIK